MKHRYRRLAGAGAATVGVAVTALVLAGPTASAEQCGGSDQAPSIVAKAIGTDCVLSAGRAALATGESGRILVATPNVASPPAEPETGKPAPQIPEETPSGAPQIPEETPSSGPQVPETSPPETPPGETMSPAPEVPSPTPPGETASPAPQVPGNGPQTPGNATPAPQVPAAVASQSQLPVTGGHGGEAAALGGTALAVGAIMVLAATRRRRPENGR